LSFTKNNQPQKIHPLKTRLLKKACGKNAGVIIVFLILDKDSRKKKEEAL